MEARKVNEAMDLSAYFDESGSDTDERDLVFAGLVNRDNAWARLQPDVLTTERRPPAR